MSWALTWQDPAAWLVIIICLAAIWRWGRTGGGPGCSSCGVDDVSRDGQRVSLGQTRLGERLKE